MSIVKMAESLVRVHRQWLLPFAFWMESKAARVVVSPKDYRCLLLNYTDRLLNGSPDKISDRA